MSKIDRLGKLRDLLDKVQHNRERPRTVEAHPASISTAPAELEEMLDEDVLDEDDIVELDPARASEAPASAAGERPQATSPVEESEPPPRSSQRPIAGSVDQALAEAAEREHPPKTPPPESGPEAVPHADRPELDSGALPGDFEEPALSQGLPTTAQLGNTVQLEEGAPADLEIDAPFEVQVNQTAEAEELEMDLPRANVAGTYDSQLAPPPEAERELRERRERELEREREQKASLEAHPSSIGPADGGQADVSPVTPQAEEAPSGATEAYGRPPVRSEGVAHASGGLQNPAPNTFLAALEASLALGND